MKFKLLCVFCFLQLLFSGFSFSNSDSIVAIVNDTIITQSELDNNLAFIYMQMSQQLQGEELENEFGKYKGELLSRMIEDKLILQEAERRGLTANEDMVEAKVDEVKAQFPSQEELNLFLVNQGLTLSDLKEQFRNEILMRGVIDREVRSKIVIHPQEITDYYAAHTEEFKEQEALEVDFISLLIEEKEELIKNLEELNDFDELAEKYPNSKNHIIVHHGDFREEIEETMRSLEIGKITPPIDIDNNVYIFRLVGQIEGYTRSLNDVQNYINNKLQDMKMREELAKWVEGLKKGAYIIIK